MKMLLWLGLTLMTILRVKITEG